MPLLRMRALSSSSVLNCSLPKFKRDWKVDRKSSMVTNSQLVFSHVRSLSNCSSDTTLSGTANDHFVSAFDIMESNLATQACCRWLAVLKAPPDDWTQIFSGKDRQVALLQYCNGLGHLESQNWGMTSMISLQYVSLKARKTYSTHS